MRATFLPTLIMKIEGTHRVRTHGVLLLTLTLTFGLSTRKPSDEKLSRGMQSRCSIFTVLVLVLDFEYYCLGPYLGLDHQSCYFPYCLGLVPRDQDSSRHPLESANNLLTRQKPSWQSTWSVNVKSANFISTRCKGI